MLLSTSRRPLVTKRGECFAPLEDVAERLGERRLGRQLDHGRFGPGEERLEQRRRLLAVFNPLGGRGEPGLVLDDIDCGDTVERLLGDRRFCLLPHVEYLAPAMRPAGNFDDRAWLGAGGVVHRLEAAIAVGLEEAGEAGHVRRRALAAAVGVVEVGGTAYFYNPN